jgi:hypothetical protein
MGKGHFSSKRGFICTNRPAPQMITGMVIWRLQNTGQNIYGDHVSRQMSSVGYSAENNFCLD